MTEETQNPKASFYSLVRDLSLAVLALLVQYQYVQKARAEQALKRAQNDVEIEKAKAAIDKADAIKTPRQVIAEFLSAAKIIPIILAFSIASSALAAPPTLAVAPMLVPYAEEKATGYTPDECLRMKYDYCACYTESQLDKISGAVTEMKKCHAELILLKDFNAKTAATEQPALWWQEPTAIVAGVAISFSLGLALGAYFTRH